jgi:hypothetical protein
MRKSDSLRRRRPVRERLARFLIVCEGRVTERCYFSELRHLDRSPVSLEFVTGATPKTLVEIAAKRKHESESAARRAKDQNLKFDEVWCVFDVDEHPYLPEATQQARDNGIKTAISNPCFELWALLHFQDQRAYIHRHKVQDLCKQYMPGYEKKLPCAELMDKYDQALQRAINLSQWHQSRGTPGENPSTGAHDLVQAIRSQRAGWQ